MRLALTTLAAGLLAAPALAQPFIVPLQPSRQNQPPPASPVPVAPPQAEATRDAGPQPGTPPADAGAADAGAPRADSGAGQGAPQPQPR